MEAAEESLIGIVGIWSALHSAVRGPMGSTIETVGSWLSLHSAVAVPWAQLSKLSAVG